MELPIITMTQKHKVLHFTVDIFFSKYSPNINKSNYPPFLFFSCTFSETKLSKIKQTKTKDAKALVYFLLIVFFQFKFQKMQHGPKQNQSSTKVE